MALEEKLGKSAKRTMAKEKEKSSGSRHAVMEEHSGGGYTVEKHDHGRDEGCEGDCETSAHKSHGSAMKKMREHFAGVKGDEGEE